jgi:hypothetical protein
MTTIEYGKGKTNSWADWTGSVIHVQESILGAKDGYFMAGSASSPTANIDCSSLTGWTEGAGSGFDASVDPTGQFKLYGANAGGYLYIYKTGVNGITDSDNASFMIKWEVDSWNTGLASHTIASQLNTKRPTFNLNKKSGGSVIQFYNGSTQVDTSLPADNLSHLDCVYFNGTTASWYRDGAYVGDIRVVSASTDKGLVEIDLNNPGEMHFDSLVYYKNTSTIFNSASPATLKKDLGAGNTLKKIDISTITNDSTAVTARYRASVTENELQFATWETVTFGADVTAKGRWAEIEITPGTASSGKFSALVCSVSLDLTEYAPTLVQFGKGESNDWSFFKSQTGWQDIKNTSASNGSKMLALNTATTQLIFDNASSITSETSQAGCDTVIDSNTAYMTASTAGNFTRISKSNWANSGVANNVYSWSLLFRIPSFSKGTGYIGLKLELHDGSNMYVMGINEDPNGKMRLNVYGSGGIVSLDNLATDEYHLITLARNGGTDNVGMFLIDGKTIISNQPRSSATSSKGLYYISTTKATSGDPATVSSRLKEMIYIANYVPFPTTDKTLTQIEQDGQAGYHCGNNMRTKNVYFNFNNPHSCPVKVEIKTANSRAGLSSASWEEIATTGGSCSAGEYFDLRITASGGASGFNSPVLNYIYVKAETDNSAPDTGKMFLMF